MPTSTMGANTSTSTQVHSSAAAATVTTTQGQTPTISDSGYESSTTSNSQCSSLATSPSPSFTTTTTSQSQTPAPDYHQVNNSMDGRTLPPLQYPLGNNSAQLQLSLPSFRSLFNVRHLQALQQHTAPSAEFLLNPEDDVPAEQRPTLPSLSSIFNLPRLPESQSPSRQPVAFLLDPEDHAPARQYPPQSVGILVSSEDVLPAPQRPSPLSFALILNTTASVPTLQLPTPPPDEIVAERVNTAAIQPLSLAAVAPLTPPPHSDLENVLAIQQPETAPQAVANPVVAITNVLQQDRLPESAPVAAAQIADYPQQAVSQLHVGSVYIGPEQQESATWKNRAQKPEDTLAELGLIPEVFPRLDIPGKAPQPAVHNKNIPSLASVLYILIAKGGPITSNMAKIMLRVYAPSMPYKDQSVRRALSAGTSFTQTDDDRSWRLRNFGEPARDKKKGGADWVQDKKRKTRDEEVQSSASTLKKAKTARNVKVHGIRAAARRQ